MEREWSVEYTNEFEDWWNTLTIDEQDAVEACIPFLRRRGPALGRPLVDTVKKSRHPNMKELRPPATNIGILFAFDPRRVAILLIGGDKTDRWQEWYDKNIPIAVYDEYLEELRREGELP
jgi:hypothetical protein